MKMHTYLNFGGNCEEAFRFYEKHLGGKIGTIMKHSESPQPGNIDPKFKDKVLHARMSLGDAELMGADIPGFQPIRSVYLSVITDSDADAERIYKTLSEGGEKFMPLQETFFATRFGQCRDRFGVSWMVVHEKPAPVRA